MCHLPGGWRLTVDVTVHCACTCVRRFNRSVSFVLQFKRVAFMHTISRRNCLWLVDWLRKRKPISETSSFRLRSFQISLKCVYFSFWSDLILFFYLVLLLVSCVVCTYELWNTCTIPLVTMTSDPVLATACSTCLTCYFCSSILMIFGVNILSHE